MFLSYNKTKTYFSVGLKVFKLMKKVEEKKQHWNENQIANGEKHGSKSHLIVSVSLVAMLAKR